MIHQKMNLTEVANINNIFTNNSYTYYEYVRQLNSLEHLLGEATFKEEYDKAYKFDDIKYEIKRRCINLGLTESDEYRKGMYALSQLNSQSCISHSGKKAEDQVSNVLSKYVTRKDYESYRGIYLIDENGEDTEIDNLILTKDGLLLLEIKKISSDACIERDGRLYVDAGVTHDSVPLAEKMDRKRKILKHMLKKALRDKGVSIDIDLDSFIVFYQPRNCRYRIQNFSKEKWCTSAKLPYIVNQKETVIPYTDEQFEILKECLSNFETNKKGFVSKLDMVQMKEDAINLVELVNSKQPKVSKIKKIQMNLPSFETVTRPLIYAPSILLGAAVGLALQSLNKWY